MRSCREMIMLASVLTLAAMLRFGWAGVNSFSFDEARLSHMALQMARDGKFAALGMQSSTGVPNFPAAVWLFAVPYWFTTNPLVATWLVALLSTLAVLGMWWLAREAWGTWAGLSVALLFSASPYVVYYSRNIWSQNLLAPLAVLWAVAGVWSVARQSRRALALHAFLAGFVLQVHLAGIALLLGSLWLGIRYRLWRQWPAVLVGGAIALLAAMPTVYTIWRYGEGAKAELREIARLPAHFVWENFRQLGIMGVGLRWQNFWLNASWQWAEPLQTALILASIVLGIGIAVGCAIVGRHLLTDLVADWRQRQLPGTERPGQGAQVITALLPAWALAAPLFFLRTKTPVYPQYQLVSLPALLLMAGAVVTLSRREAWGVIITLAALAIAVVQSMAIGQTLTTVGQRLVPGGMGTPLSYPQAAVSTLRADNRPVVVHSHGDIAEFEGDAAVFRVLFWGYPHQIADGRSVLLIPGRPAHLLFTFATLPAWEIARELGLAGTIQELPRREGEPPYLALTTNGLGPAAFEPTEPYLLENGAELQGWLAQQISAEGRLRLITCWQINGSIREGHYQQFNHLYHEGDAAPAAIQDVATSSRAWQSGDYLITWAEFDPARSFPVYFDVGMYTWPELQRSPVLNRAGDPLAPIRLMLPALPEP